MKLDAAAIDAQNAVEEAKARASAAEARAETLQTEVLQLVEASKLGGDAHATQMQELQKELREAKKIASECRDAKVILLTLVLLCVCIGVLLLCAEALCCDLECAPENRITAYLSNTIIWNTLNIAPVPTPPTNMPRTPTKCIAAVPIFSTATVAKQH